MAILFFLITATAGILLTTIIIRSTHKNDTLTKHQHALILATCFFVTWLCSFFAPFMAPELIKVLKRDLIIFGLAHSAFIGVIAYCVGFFLFGRKKNKKP